jgi:hypothetical protein
MSFGMGVPPLKNVEVALLGQVALEEAIDHAYPQTRFEGPHIRLGELPYLLAVGARPSRHFFKEFDSGRRISSSRVRVSPDFVSRTYATQKIWTASRLARSCGLSYPVYNTEVMRLFRLWRYARGTSLLAVVMVCCVGAFLCLLPTELDASAALTTPHLLSPDQGANQGYLAVPQEEAGDADGRPVNADLLSVLLFVVCFGVSVGWLLTNAQGQGALCFSSVGVVGEVLGRAREDYLPFLGVFRL